MDYTQVIEDFKNTQKFKDFLLITGGKVISTDRQAKNGTIEIGNIDIGKGWKLLSNGYVREGIYGIHPWTKSKTPVMDQQTNILRRPKDAPSIVDINLYLSGIDVILKQFKKRDDLQKKRINKVNSNFKAHKIVIYSLFDKMSVEYYDESNKVWKTSSPNYGIEDWGWDIIIKTIGNPQYAKIHRIKK